MLIELLVCLVLAVLALLVWLSRPVGGTVKLEDWAAKNELTEVPRAEWTLPFVGNGWYRLVDEKDLGCEQEMRVKCLGRDFLVRRLASGDVSVVDSTGKAWDVERALDMVLVWYHAENEQPTYFVKDCAPSIPSSHVCHGMTKHHVRCALQDVFENGADLAHFKAVHEDGAKSFGLVGKLLKLRLIFQGFWEVNPKFEYMSNALVENHIQILGHDFVSTKQTVKVNQIGPSLAIEDSPQGVLGKRIFILQSTTPISPFEHLEITRFYSEPGMVARVGVHLFVWGFRGNLEVGAKILLVDFSHCEIGRHSDSEQQALFEESHFGGWRRTHCKVPTMVWTVLQRKQSKDGVGFLRETN
jgi:hypothetical protein